MGPQPDVSNCTTSSKTRPRGRIWRGLTRQLCGDVQRGRPQPPLAICRRRVASRPELLQTLFLGDGDRRWIAVAVAVDVVVAVASHKPAAGSGPAGCIAGHRRLSKPQRRVRVICKDTRTVI